uniref:Store-operated calcium entry-associated regulatory factor n=1 Tax=Trichobilharzia regenti TaxID=157069 RepID=A0AA85J1D8_TRIRE|nr:unnamed protein product [Trichobilharzia regenti]
MFVFVPVIISLLFCSSEAKPGRVLLKNVDVITLYHDKFAESRKGYRLPQLKCVGGSGFKYPEYYPKVVQCYNRGFDGRDVQWECKAELDKEVTFGPINVNCEGYDYPEDDYIVHGSCALEYELNVRHHKKEKRYHASFDSPYVGVRHYSSYFIIGVLILTAAGIWYFCIRSPGYPYECVSHPDAPFPSEPPPSYEETVLNNGEDYSRRRRPPPSAPREYGWSSNVTGSSRCPGFNTHWSKTNHQQESSSWLYNGLAAGAGFLGGYFMGSRTNDGGSCSRPTRVCTQESYVRNGNVFTDSHYGFTSDDSGHYRRSRTPSPETHISSGFGGTSRR